MSITSNSRADSPGNFTLVSFDEILSEENENSRKTQKAVEGLMSKQNKMIADFEKNTGEFFDRTRIPEDQHYDTKFEIHFVTKKIDQSPKASSPCSIIEREASPFKPIEEDESISAMSNLPASDLKTYTWLELKEMTN